MKKTILILLFCALLIAAGSCNAGDDINTQETTASTTVQSVDENEGKEKPIECTGKTEESETIPIEGDSDLNSSTLTTAYSTDELIEALQLSNTFASALKTEMMVQQYLSDKKESEYLDELLHFGEFVAVYAIDSDTNGTNDFVVIENLDKVILLKEYNETIFAWVYRHSALYYLRVDGTYNWHSQGYMGHIYGSSKLQFDGANKNSVELDRVENNEKFYISGIEVSQEQYSSYVQNTELAEKANCYTWETGYKISK